MLAFTEPEPSLRKAVTEETAKVTDARQLVTLVSGALAIGLGQSRHHWRLVTGACRLTDVSSDLARLRPIRMPTATTPIPR